MTSQVRPILVKIRLTFHYNNFDQPHVLAYCSFHYQIIDGWATEFFRV